MESLSKKNLADTLPEAENSSDELWAGENLMKHLISKLRREQDLSAEEFRMLLTRTFKKKQICMHGNRQIRCGSRYTEMKSMYVV